jgi:hypothetical protein
MMIVPCTGPPVHVHTLHFVVSALRLVHKENLCMQGYPTLLSFSFLYIDLISFAEFKIAIFVRIYIRLMIFLNMYVSFDDIF